MNSLLKASAAMPDLDRLLIVTLEETSPAYSDHSDIELIPIDLFLLKGLA